MTSFTLSSGRNGLIGRCSLSTVTCARDRDHGRLGRAWGAKLAPRAWWPFQGLRDRDLARSGDRLIANLWSLCTQVCYHALVWFYRWSITLDTRPSGGICRLLNGQHWRRRWRNSARTASWDFRIPALSGAGSSGSGNFARAGDGRDGVRCTGGLGT